MEIPARHWMMQRISDEGRLAEGWTVDTAAEAVWALGLPGTWAHLGVQRGWTPEAYGDFLVRAANALVVAPPATPGDRS